MTILTLLTVFDRFWPFFLPYWLLLTVVDRCGPFLTGFYHFKPFSIFFDCFWPYWTVLTLVDNCWLFLMFLSVFSSSFFVRFWLFVDRFWLFWLYNTQVREVWVLPVCGILFRVNRCASIHVALPYFLLDTNSFHFKSAQFKLTRNLPLFYPST